jgi:hypothetical protein
LRVNYGPVAERQAGAVPISADTDRLGADMAEVSAGAGADRFPQQVFEVLAV